MLEYVRVLNVCGGTGGACGGVCVLRFSFVFVVFANKREVLRFLCVSLPGSSKHPSSPRSLTPCRTNALCTGVHPSQIFETSFGRLHALADVHRELDVLVSIMFLQSVDTWMGSHSCFVARRLRPAHSLASRPTLPPIPSCHTFTNQLCQRHTLRTSAPHRTV